MVVTNPTKKKKQVECQFCHKMKAAQGIRMHEKHCKGRVQQEEEPAVKECMTIEQLMEEIKMGKEHVLKLRQELGNRLSSLGLIFRKDIDDDDDESGDSTTKE